MSRRDAAKIAVFSMFLTIFWFKHSIFFHRCFTNDWIQQKKLKNSMRKRIGSREIGKSGNGNVFQNLMKIFFNLFGKKS